MSKIHKFDSSRGSKAYSYFGTIVKRWLILYNENNYKKRVKSIPIENIQDLCYKLDEKFYNEIPSIPNNAFDPDGNDFDKKVDLASLMFEIKDTAEIENPNNVKVVTDQNGFALYFSRSVIPYPRDINAGVRYMKHIGIYAYKKDVLEKICQLQESTNEKKERLEQLRWLDNNYTIKVGITNFQTLSVDTPEDIEKIKVQMR